MRVIITKLDKVTSKKSSAKWVIGKYVSTDGKTGDFILDEKTFDSYKVEVVPLDSEDLADIFASTLKSQINLYFDQSGRVDSLQAVPEDLE